MGELMTMKNAINDTLTPINSNDVDYVPGPSDSSASEENRIQKNLKEKISLLQQVWALVNDLKGAKYVLEEKYCLLKDLNESINAKEAKRNKYKTQVHGTTVFLDHMKDALARETQISQSKSMELDALRKEKDNESLYMLQQVEIEKAKCSSDEEEDDKSIKNKTFPKRSTLDQRFAGNE